uniref:Uncharacterized protein n=1 Tax=Rhizophora mucronata TaxID=61149 RepID=A0A2P2PDG0_RHIMU
MCFLDWLIEKENYCHITKPSF